MYILGSTNNPWIRSLLLTVQLSYLFTLGSTLTQILAKQDRHRLTPSTAESSIPLTGSAGCAAFHRLLHTHGDGGLSLQRLLQLPHRAHQLRHRAQQLLRAGRFSFRPLLLLCGGESASMARKVRNTEGCLLLNWCTSGDVTHNCRPDPS